MWSISVTSFTLRLISVDWVLFCSFELNENKHSFISVGVFCLVLGFFCIKPQTFNICGRILSCVVSSLCTLLQNHFLTSFMNIIVLTK